MALGEAMKDIAVTEEEAKEYYKANEDQFMAGETVHAKHILVDDEDKCQEILEKIIAEEVTFEDAAKEFSTCPSNQQGGDLGGNVLVHGKPEEVITTESISELYDVHLDVAEIDGQKFVLTV